MLYGNESIAYYSRSNVIVWMSLALQAGLLNVGGFFACHKFVSHVTGYATHFGYEVSQHSGWQALGMLVVPLSFLFGAMISGQLVDLRLKLHKKPRYYITFGIMFFLVMLVYVCGIMGYLGNFGQTKNDIHSYFLLMLLCLVCGIQNATITTVSKSIIRTTHLTGITTDLGIGIIRQIHQKNIPLEFADEHRANLMRLGIIFFFGLGSVLGAIVFNRFGFRGFLAPTVTSGGLFLTMFYFQVYKVQRTIRIFN